MKLKNSFSVNLTYPKTAKLKEQLQQIADQEEVSTHADLLKILVDTYTGKQGSEAPKPRTQPKPTGPPSGEHVFYVKYSPRLESRIEKMREYFAEELDAPEDRDILKYFFQLTHKIQAKKVMILETPGALSQLLGKKAEEDINIGKVKSVGEWLRRYLVSHFSKPEKKNDSWFS